MDLLTLISEPLSLYSRFGQLVSPVYVCYKHGVHKPCLVHARMPLSMYVACPSTRAAVLS
jgi:hypothetical protein